MYNPKSLKADEFINHQEIIDTLDYAEKNKNNLELINKILEKAELRKGLTHREASVLLACEDKNITEEENRSCIDLKASDKMLYTENDTMFEIKYPNKDIICRVKTRQYGL